MSILLIEFKEQLDEVFVYSDRTYQDNCVKVVYNYSCYKYYVQKFYVLAEQKGKIKFFNAVADSFSTDYENVTTNKLISNLKYL